MGWNRKWTKCYQRKTIRIEFGSAHGVVECICTYQQNLKNYLKGNSEDLISQIMLDLGMSGKFIRTRGIDSGLQHIVAVYI